MSAPIDELLAHFDERFGTQGKRMLAVHAPARTEIAGNHTDHEGGDVIGGALDAAITAVCAPNGTMVANVESIGWEPFSVDLTDLAPREAEHVTTASLLRGMAAQLAEAGREPQGFDLVMTSTIPGGSGLSSSAAVELAFGRAMEALWEGKPVDAVTMAQMAQRAENEWFGKPCGLLDQLSEALGGLAHMGFADPAQPTSEKLEFDFEAAGYAVCLVYLGCDHSALTHEYAAVPAEMTQVARAFGAERLCEVDPAEFEAHIGELRAELGDRPVLRALHYWEENDLVAQRWDALRGGDVDAFLAATRASGASSAMFLQNVSCGGNDQPAMVALALAERILAGRGACRIHGGGFGGSIQAFVPLNLVDEFCERMDRCYGEGACRRYRIVSEGAGAQWL